MVKPKTLVQTIILAGAACVAGCGSLDIQFTRGPPVNMQETPYENLLLSQYI